MKKQLLGLAFVGLVISMAAPLNAAPIRRPNVGQRRQAPQPAPQPAQQPAPQAGIFDGFQQYVGDWVFESVWNSATNRMPSFLKSESFATNALLFTVLAVTLKSMHESGKMKTVGLIILGYMLKTLGIENAQVKGVNVNDRVNTAKTAFAQEVKNNFMPTPPAQPAPQAAQQPAPKSRFATFMESLFAEEPATQS